MHEKRTRRTLTQNYVTQFCVYAYMVNGPEAAPNKMVAPTTQPTFSYDADRLKSSQNQDCSSGKLHFILQPQL